MESSWCGDAFLEATRGIDHQISRNHLLKRGALLNGQKLGNLVLYMTLGSVLALCFKFDCICCSKDSKFDTAAALISKWTAKSIECGVRAAISDHVCTYCVRIFVKY